MIKFQEYLNKMAEQYKLTNEAHENIYDTVKALGREHFASEGQVITDRNKTPLNEGSWTQYGWTRGARLLAPKREGVLVRDSPLLDITLAEKAVEANRNGSVFHVKEIYEDSLKTAKREDKDRIPLAKRTALILPSRKTFVITPKQYFELLEFSAGTKQGRTYLENFGKAKINELQFILPDVDFVDAQKAPFVQQSWLNDLAYRSDLNGDSRGLVDHSYAFGVFSVSERVSASKHKISEGKNSDTYTEKQIRKVLEELGFSGLEKFMLEKLRGRE